MEWTLSTSGNFYSVEDAKKLEKLGFKFEKDDSFPNQSRYMIDDYETNNKITINNLEDLEQLQKTIDSQLIINFENKTIEIYDDYRE